MNVTRYTPVDAPLELIDRLAGNYFFSSTSFANLWATMGGKPVYWLAEKAGRVLAVLPGVEFGRGRLRRFQSMPNGCYAKLLFNTDEPESFAEIAQNIIGRILDEKYVKTFLMDFHKTIPNDGRFEAQKYTVYLVDVSAPDWEPPDAKLRQQIHKAGRANLVLKDFDPANNMESFMRLVGLHERRRSTKVTYSRAFFEALAAVSATDKRVKWVWCEHDGQPVASHIFFTEGNSLMHWQMYYDEEFSHLHATKFIPFIVSSESAASGIKYLNLGLSPEGAEGAEFYKSKWGGTPYSYEYYIHKSFLGRLL